MNALQYAQELVAFESTSLRSNVDVTEYVESVLKKLGAVTERVDYDDEHGVRKANVVGKLGSGTGGIAYFGHTDVVPADPWFSDQHGPFQPTVKGDKLYGRGSCDMKGSIACMLAAASRFPREQLSRPVYITCTADEEIGYGGAAEVASRSELYREMVTGKSRGIIGEPTRLQVVYAHKGTYGFRATARGKAAHSSTREGINANLAMIPFLVEMKRLYEETERDPNWQSAEFDPPTISMNIGINDHTKAVNITPPQSICTVYFRPMPGQDADLILDRARQAARTCGIEFEALHSGQALYIDPRSEYVREMLELAGQRQPQTVCYGTDGTMLGDLEHRIVFGPGDIAQAHTWDEWIELDQLERGADMFTRAIKRWCT